MKDIIKGVVGASGEQWFGFIVLCFCASIATIMVKVITSDHIIRCYYMQSQPTDAGIAYKIIGDVDWLKDTIVYTSHDGDKVLDVISKMKQCGVDN